MPGTQIVFTEDDRRELRRMRDKLDGIRGTGVTNTAYGITINSPPAARPNVTSAPELSLAYITGITAPPHRAGVTPSPNATPPGTPLGGGTYTGTLKLKRPATPRDPTVNLQATDTPYTDHYTPAAGDVYLLNPAEAGLPSHDLYVSTNQQGGSPSPTSYPATPSHYVWVVPYAPAKDGVMQYVIVASYLLTGSTPRTYLGLNDNLSLTWDQVMTP